MANKEKYIENNGNYHRLNRACIFDVIMITSCILFQKLVLIILIKHLLSIIYLKGWGPMKSLGYTEDTVFSLWNEAVLKCFTWLKRVVYKHTKESGFLS